jgi:hypothetical protein
MTQERVLAPWKDDVGAEAAFILVNNKRPEDHAFENAATHL